MAQSRHLLVEEATRGALPRHAVLDEPEDDLWTNESVADVERHKDRDENARTLKRHLLRLRKVRQQEAEDDWLKNAYDILEFDTTS